MIPQLIEKLRSYSLIALLAEKLAKKDYSVKKIRWVKEKFDNNHPSLTVTQRILRGTNPHHRKTLIKTFNSPMFRSIRCQLPVYENLLRACCLIDRPEVSRTAIEEHGAYFTHEGAEILYEYLTDEIDQYAEEYGEIADPLWEKYFSKDTKG